MQSPEFENFKRKTNLFFDKKIPENKKIILSAGRLTHPKKLSLFN